MAFISSDPRAPIGIFDSGVGGLSVFRQVQRLLPSEAIIYLADTANVPYGDKPLRVVCDLALKLTAHLARSGVKMVIMASGTSTVAGLRAAQERYPALPILGTIDPGARAAIIATSGPIGVLSTNATAQSRAFTQAIQRLDLERTVIEQGCPRFVPLVESGRANSPEALDAAAEYLAPLLDACVEMIILGCTHFPFLLPALKEALENAGRSQIRFIDPAEEAVREAASILTDRSLLAAYPSGDCPVRFAATGDPQDFSFHAGRLLGIAPPPVASLMLE